MAFDLSSFLSPETIFGSSGVGALGFVTGHVKSRNGKIRQLEKEVAECRRRDADVIVLKAGVRLLVGKMQRDHSDSVELRMFADLCARRFGPAPETDDGFADLLRQIDEADDQHGEGHHEQGD